MSTNPGHISRECPNRNMGGLGGGGGPRSGLQMGGQGRFDDRGGAYGNQRGPPGGMGPVSRRPSSRAVDISGGIMLHLGASRAWQSFDASLFLPHHTCNQSNTRARAHARTNSLATLSIRPPCGRRYSVGTCTLAPHTGDPGAPSVASTARHAEQPSGSDSGLDLRPVGPRRAREKAQPDTLAMLVKRGPRPSDR